MVATYPWMLSPKVWHWAKMVWTATGFSCDTSNSRNCCMVRGQRKGKRTVDYSTPKNGKTWDIKAQNINDFNSMKLSHLNMLSKCACAWIYIIIWFTYKLPPPPTPHLFLLLLLFCFCLFVCFTYKKEKRFKYGQCQTWSMPASLLHSNNAVLDSSWK